MFLTLPGDITTLQLYLLYSAVNSLRLSMKIVGIGRLCRYIYIR